MHREARAIARLKHPNIVLLYDAAKIDGKHFLALEYVDGMDLNALLHKRGPFPISLACDCVRQAALGLQHAHEHGLVHRDIKPSNLVMTRVDTAPAWGRLRSPKGEREGSWEGLIKILDLGLVRLYPVGVAPRERTKLSMDGYVVGTPDYLAPEQALDSHTVDIRADIYSLGCTFYELLTGEPPFGHVPDGTEKLLSHLQTEPTPIEHHRPDVPARVAAVVRKMMAKQRHERFEMPGQAADELAVFAKPRAALPDVADRSSASTPPDASRRVDATNVIGVLCLAPSDKTGLSIEGPRELGAHKGGIHCLMVSPDGRLALSGGDDQAVHLWDVVKGKKARRLLGHTDAVRCVAFAPDGRTAVSGGSDGALILWDIDAGQMLAQSEGRAEVTSAAFSPDGKFVLTGGKDQGLRLWEVARRRYVRQLGGVVRSRHFDAVAGVAFAPDGGRAVSVSLDKTLRLWNLQTGAEVHCFQGHTDEVYCVAYSPDGLHVASAGRDATVRLCSVVTGEEVRRFDGHTSSVYGIAFSPRGRQLLTAGDTTIRLWDVATGRQLYWCKADADRVLCVALTPDGNHLLAAGGEGVLRLWSKAI
jgi:WD40 repeat protein